MEYWEGILLPDMHWINKLGDPYSFFFDEIAKMPGVVIDKEK